MARAALRMLPNHRGRTRLADRLDSGVGPLGEFVAISGASSGALARSSHASCRISLELQSFRFRSRAKGAAS